MSMRTAFRQNNVLFVGLLFAIGWIGLTVMNVSNSMGAIATDNWVGHHGLGGIVGIVGLGLILLFAVTAYSELAETEPVPESWPPDSSE